MMRALENVEKLSETGRPTMRQFGLLLLAICFILSAIAVLLHAPAFGTAIVILAVIAGALITSGS